MELKKGNMIKITLDDAHMENCSDEILWLDYKNITKVVEVGSKIYIDDGLISLQVKEIGELKSAAVNLIQCHSNLKASKTFFALSLSLSLLRRQGPIS